MRHEKTMPLQYLILLSFGAVSTMAFAAELPQRLTPPEEALMARLDAKGLAALLRGEPQALPRDPAEGLLFFPLEACRLIDGETLSGEVPPRSARLLGPTGCGLAPLEGRLLSFSAARSALLRVELREADGDGSLTLWPAGAPRPADSLLDFASGAGMLIVPVCAEAGIAPCENGDLSLAARGASVKVTVDLLGYFAPPAASAAVSASGSAENGGGELGPRSLASPFWEEGTGAGVIHYSDGYVGIGTSAPIAPLTVVGGAASYPNARAARFVIRGESASFRDQVAVTNESAAAGNTGYGIAFAGQGNHRAGIYARDVGGSSSATGELNLWTRSGGNIILSGGNTGIGVSNPSAKLHLGGDFKLNLGEGLLIAQDPGYWSGAYDARLIQILDSNGTGGNADGGIVFESHSLDDDQRRPILTLRHPSGYPKVGIATVFPAGLLEAHSRRQNGSGTLSSIGTAVTGTGTSFLGKLMPGSEITVGGETRRVTTVASETALTLNVAFNTDLTDAAFTYQQPALLLTAEGRLGLGTGDAALTEKIEIVGNLKLTGNLLAGGDLCIGACN